MEYRRVYVMKRSAGKLNTKEIKPFLIECTDKCGHHTEGICSSRSLHRNFQINSRCLK